MHQQKRICQDEYRELSVSPMRAQGTTSCDLSLVAVAYATETTGLSSGDVDGPLSGDLKRCHLIDLILHQLLDWPKRSSSWTPLNHLLQSRNVYALSSEAHPLNFHSQSTDVSKWLKYSNYLSGETNHSCEHSVFIIKIQL